MSETPAKPATKRRLRWLWPVIVVLVWLAAAGPLGSFAGKLTTVQENDNASFLPATAESTKVSELQRRFQETETAPTIILWEAESGITPPMVQAAAERVQRISTIEGIEPGSTGPIPSQDGKALSAIVQLRADVGDDFPKIVEEIREIAPIGGTTAYVTGPGGIAADLFETFGEIDGLLLGVALLVVLIILLVVYRSPLLPFVVILSALLALSAASAVVYALASNDIITLNGQSQAILFILVVGAATDYALLLVARYREELYRHQSKYDAMRIALRQVFEPTIAAGGTVILGVLCLLFSDLNSNKSLGPVAALGIVGALVAVLTFLPAALVLLGRAAFWPFRPKYDGVEQEHTGIYASIAEFVSRRPRMLWVGTVAVLAVFAAFAPTFKDDGVSQTDLFLNEVESVTGQEAFGRHYPAGSGSPTVIIANAPQADAVAARALTVPGVSAASVTRAGPPGNPDPTAPVRVVDGLAQIEVTLTEEADSVAATTVVEPLRDAVHDVPDANALVGGLTAILHDTQVTTERDTRVILPIILLVILVVLALLLRSILAPVLLVATVVLSFAATMGVAALMFNYVFDFPGSDPGTPLIAFVFLVALGIDYNIFLMTRTREESFKRDTRDGVLVALAVTGAVITSAGVVLAATFGTLGVLPILFLVQTAFIVAFGVLLDALIVRTLLVPALTYDLGKVIWWPSKLSKAEPQGGAVDQSPAQTPVEGDHFRSESNPASRS